jgi:hypothetical protein
MAQLHAKLMLELLRIIMFLLYRCLLHGMGWVIETSLCLQPPGCTRAFATIASEISEGTLAGLNRAEPASERCAWSLAGSAELMDS